MANWLWEEDIIFKNNPITFFMAGLVSPTIEIWADLMSPVFLIRFLLSISHGILFCQMRRQTAHWEQLTGNRWIGMSSTREPSHKTWYKSARCCFIDYIQESLILAKASSVPLLVQLFWCLSTLLNITLFFLNDGISHLFLNWLSLAVFFFCYFLLRWGTTGRKKNYTRV